MKPVSESKIVIIGLGFLMEYIYPCFVNSLHKKITENIIGVTADEKDLQGKKDRLGFRVLLNDNTKALNEMKPDLIFFAPPPTLAKPLCENVLKPYYEQCRRKGETIPVLFAFPPSPPGAYYMEMLGDDLQVINIIPNMMTKAGQENIANERCNLITYPHGSNWPQTDRKKVEDFFLPYGSCLNCTPDNILYVLSTEIATHPLTEICDVAARCFNARGIDCDYRDVASVLRKQHQLKQGYLPPNSNNCSLDDIKDDDAKEILAEVLEAYYGSLGGYIRQNGLNEDQTKQFLDPLFDIYFHITQVSSREEIIAKAKKDATKGGMLELCMESYHKIIEPLLEKIFSADRYEKRDVVRVGQLMKEIIAAVVERGKGLTGSSQPIFSPKQHSIMFGLAAKKYLDCFDDGNERLYKAVERYGMERGSRMAQRCSEQGDPLDMVGYFAYSEWKWDDDFQKENIQFSPYYAHYVFRCPWCNGWEENGLADYGHYYCRNVDASILKGFNPELKLEMPSHLSGKEYDRCEFRWVDADMNEDFQRRQRAIKEKIKDTCIRSFEYHTAHTYMTLMDELYITDPEKAEAIDEEVRREFAEKTSYLELMLVLYECNHDFKVAD